MRKRYSLTQINKKLQVWRINFVYVLDRLSIKQKQKIVQQVCFFFDYSIATSMTYWFKILTCSLIYAYGISVSEKTGLWQLPNVYWWHIKPLWPSTYLVWISVSCSSENTSFSWLSSATVFPWWRWLWWWWWLRRVTLSVWRCLLANAPVDNDVTTRTPTSRFTTPPDSILNKEKWKKL